ncbi:carbohydrate ABC transporter permease [Bacillus sp. SD088]|uniref:carbohydrate ABC transporter permease n=1 Tax=Bacillus sp. SD088 TaxID=2782012 RepID=UPI001A974DD1|nr:sugar ABC transporter permease [Bacillus sp. SD088]MBO0993127.1 sugar ABC transporter permease [Bacillus sp. SD088]
MFTLKRKTRENLWAYLFIGPQILGLLLFIIGPVIFAFAISFTQWDIGSSPKWIGFENYEKQISDPVFLKVVKNTSIYALINIPLTMIGALAIALMLNQNIRGKVILRTAYFMPVVTSSVAVALVWTWMYNPNFGLINSGLAAVGIEGPSWLASLKWALPSIVFMTVWQGIGYNMILFLAGLQGIPKHLYEAATIDGANSWQRFWKITFPMLSPTTFFVLIMLLIGSFQIFNEPYMMTNGGPADATNVFVLHIYNTAFQFYKMGEASAISFILFAIILVFTLVQFKFSKWVNYDA